MTVSIELDRLFEVVHHIDVNQHEVGGRNIPDGDLDEYNKLLVGSMLEADNKRYFKFKSDTTEVNTLVNKIINGSTDDEKIVFTDAIANRLLREEISAQERYAHLTDLQKGSLVQSYITTEQGDYYLITKIEHEKFLNTDELINQIGLPYEKRTLKSCLITINDEQEITDIIVTDSNNRISSYWYNDFLELEELNTDERNTKSAFTAVDSILTRSVKSQSAVDHSLLRNNLIGYFRTSDTYNHQQMIQEVFGDYRPEKPDAFDIEIIKTRVNQVSEREQFDSVFNIKDDTIKARMKRKVKINDKIELIINGHIHQLKNVIHSEKKPNGDKYLYIKTEDEETFNMFKYN